MTRARCDSCGYDLTGLMSDKCPECGTMVHVESGRWSKGEACGGMLSLAMILPVFAWFSVYGAPSSPGSALPRVTFWMWWSQGIPLLLACLAYPTGFLLVHWYMFAGKPILPVPVIAISLSLMTVNLLYIAVGATWFELWRSPWHVIKVGFAGTAFILAAVVAFEIWRKRRTYAASLAYHFIFWLWAAWWAFPSSDLGGGI